MRIVQTPVFGVPEDSDTEKAIKAYIDAREAAFESWKEFATKYGADRLWSSSWLNGLIFDEKSPPEGWIRCKDMSIAYRPSLKGPLSEAAKEFKALPKAVDNVEWLRLLSLDICINGRGYKTPGFVKRDGKYYLTADPGCPIPEDVVEVTDENERSNVLKEHDNATNE